MAFHSYGWPSLAFDFQYHDAIQKDFQIAVHIFETMSDPQDMSDAAERSELINPNQQKTEHPSRSMDIDRKTIFVFALCHLTLYYCFMS